MDATHAAALALAALVAAFGFVVVTLYRARPKHRPALTIPPPGPSPVLDNAQVIKTLHRPTKVALRVVR